MRVLNYSKNDFLRFGLLLTGVNTIISLLFLRLFLGSDFDDKVLEIFNSIFSNNRLPTLPKVNEMLVTELDEVLGPKSEETLVTKADEVLKLKSNEALLATSTIPQKSIFWFIYHKEFYFCVIGAVISLYAVKSLQSEEGFFEGISTLVSSSQEIINSSIGKIHSLFHRAPVRTLPSMPNMSAIPIMDPFNNDSEDGISPPFNDFLRHLNGLPPLMTSNIDRTSDGEPPPFLWERFLLSTNWGP
jgi:hypothetical protein